MQSLALHTHNLPSLSSSVDKHADFSVLPSPSTFNLSPSYSPLAGDYSASSYDYSTHPPTAYDAPSPSHSLPSLVRSSRSPSSSSMDPPPSLDYSHWSDSASSPATSLQSTPHASPVLEPAVVDDFEGSAQLFSDFAAKESLEGSLFPSHAVLPDVDVDGMYAHHSQGAYSSSNSNCNSGVPPSTFQLPSPAASPASLGIAQQQQQQQVQYQPYDAHVQQQQQHPQQVPYYASPSPSSGLVYLDQPQPQQVVYQPHQPVQYAPVSVAAPQQQATQQPPVVQLVNINGATYAMAMPVAAPAPAAIETPHGTYYFVPSAPAAAQQQPQQLQQVATDSSSFVLSSGLPAPVAATIPGLAPLDMSLSSSPSVSHPHQHQYSPVPAPTATAPLKTSSVVPHVVPTPLDPQQKIRLPIGQGKRGSTKRVPAKKDQVKRFVCPFEGCGRGFARNFNMQSHYKSHLGVREFNCPHCTKKFSRRHDRARHCAAVHDSQVDRDGNVVGYTSASTSHSPSAGSASPSDDHDHKQDEYDELDYAPGNGSGFDYGLVGGSSSLGAL
ncbi:hypothetical protein JCM8547_006675 [Rhodosporidiobolus lusitaniae]